MKYVFAILYFTQAAAGTGKRRRKYGNLRRRDLDAMRGFRRR